MLRCSPVGAGTPALDGDDGLTGGVPKRGGLLPKAPCNAAASADWPGPGRWFGPPAPARGAVPPVSALLLAIGVLLDPVGEVARRAMDDARSAGVDTEVWVGDLGRDASDDEEVCTARGFDAGGLFCPSAMTKRYKK